MASLWQWVSYDRHRSELWALSLARRVPYLAMLPIGMVVVFWWVFAPLPIVLPALLLLENLTPFDGALLALLGIPAVVLLLLAAPWFFDWYAIAIGLMLGRPASAIAKQQALADAIQAYCAKVW